MGTPVSVIIPVYNPGDVSLRKCLESLTAQSYPDIEIVVVNDGSTDGSDGVCREFAASDRRIKYICQENAGVSAARNKGIDISAGEYICFVDSDDYVDPDYVRSMVDAAGKSHADIVIQGLKQIKAGRVISEEVFEKGVFTVASLNEVRFEKLFNYCGPYCKLFKSAVVKENGIRFPAGMSYGEDAVFWHTYLGHCRIVEFISQSAYNYTVANLNALSTKLLRPDKFWQNQSRRRGDYRRLREMFGLPEKISQAENGRKMSGICGMLNSIFKSGADDEAVRGYLYKMAHDEDFRMADVTPSGLYYKCILALVRANGGLSRRILKKIYQ